MRKIRIIDSIIYIETGVFSNLSKHIKDIYENNDIYVVTDTTLKKKYGNKLASILSDFDVKFFVYEPGESNKNIDTYQQLLSKMIEDGIKRTSLIIGFGGGAVLDMTGFIASTLYRGTRLVSIPTTIISQIDASIGGKNGVDFLGYKNVIGNFYNPLAIFIDPEFINDLPNSELTNGYGEIIKTALIGDKLLFNFIKNNSKLDEELIIRLVSVKVNVVEQDYKDVSTRRILNFGHTMGHAIESKSKFKFSHGEAIAHGMIFAIKLGMKLGITNPDVLDQVKEIFNKYNLAKEEINYKEYLDYIKYDKKSDSKGIEFIFIKDIGIPEIKFITFEDCENI